MIANMVQTLLLGIMIGAGLVLGAIGLYQILVTKGYTIAIELYEAGWTVQELKQHKKTAMVLPWIQRQRETGKAS